MFVTLDELSHNKEGRNHRTAARFEEKDRVVVYTEKNIPVHGTVRWTGRYSLSEIEAAFVIGIETVRWWVRV